MSATLATLSVQDVHEVRVKRHKFRRATGYGSDFDIVRISADGLEVNLFTSPGGLANLVAVTVSDPIEESA